MALITFKKWTCRLVYREYGNGRTAILLTNDKLGPIATATVNLPDVDLPENHVLIKDYEENEGMLKALTRAGVVRDTGKRHKTGWVQVPECELLQPAPEAEAA